MSSKITYSTTDLQKLTNEVEQTFGKKVLNQNHCKRLRIDIGIKTSETLGLNTLRRFFKIIPSNHKPYISTLDILSSYCGYASFQLFLQQKVSNTGISNQLLISLITQKEIDWKSFIHSLHETYGTPHLYNTVQKAILVAHQQKEYSLFWQVFEIDYLWQIEGYNKRDAFELVQLISAIIKTLENKNEIVQKIALQKKGFFFFEWNVDVDNLTSFYGDWLIEYYKPQIKLNTDLVFYECLMCFRSFLLQDKQSITHHHRNICKLNTPKILNLHPILRGRVIASGILKHSMFGEFNANKKLQIIENFNQVRNPRNYDFGLDGKLFLVYIFQALFLTKQFKLLAETVEALPKDVIKSFDYWTDNVSNHLKIYFSLAYLELGNKKQAHQLIQSVNCDKMLGFEKNIQMKAYFSVLDMFQH